MNDEIDLKVNINLNVNGVDYPVAIGYGRNLVSVLRTEIGLTGTKEGCDDCECGACMVLLDGQRVTGLGATAVTGIEIAAPEERWSEFVRLFAQPIASTGRSRPLRPS